jgi:hypothetical protein
MLMTVNSVQFRDIHRLALACACAQRDVSPRHFAPPAAPCSFERGISCVFRGELCPIWCRAAKLDIHPFRNPIRAPPR